MDSYGTLDDRFRIRIGKLGKVLQEIEYKGILGSTRTVSTQTLAYFLVVLGTVALLAASLQHWRRTRSLRAVGADHEFSITLVVALMLAAIGGLALTSLVMSLRWPATPSHYIRPLAAAAQRAT